MSDTAQLGAAAPTFTLVGSTGTINLQHYRRTHNVALYFMRDFTCFMCIKHVTALKRLNAHLKEHDTHVLVIGGGQPADAKLLAQRYDLPFPVLADPELRVYQQYGLEKALGLLQRSGLALIDKSGTLRLIHVAALPSAGFKEAELTEALNQLQTPSLQRA